MDQIVDLHRDALKDHKNWQSSAPAQSGQASKDDQYFVQPCWELELDTGIRRNDCIEMVIQYNIFRNLSGPHYHADHHIILTKDTGYFLKLTNSIGPTWFVVGSSNSWTVSFAAFLFSSFTILVKKVDQQTAGGSSDGKESWPSVRDSRQGLINTSVLKSVYISPLSIILCYTHKILLHYCHCQFLLSISEKDFVLFLWSTLTRSTV